MISGEGPLDSASDPSGCGDPIIHGSTWVYWRRRSLRRRWRSFGGKERRLHAVTGKPNSTMMG